MPRVAAPCTGLAAGRGEPPSRSMSDLLGATVVGPPRLGPTPTAGRSQSGPPPLLIRRTFVVHESDQTVTTAGGSGMNLGLAQGGEQPPASVGNDQIQL